MLLSQKNMKTERRPLISTTSCAEGAGLPGGQPQNYPSKINEEVLDLSTKKVLVPAQATGITLQASAQTMWDGCLVCYASKKP